MLISYSFPAFVALVSLSIYIFPVKTVLSFRIKTKWGSLTCEPLCLRLFPQERAVDLLPVDCPSPGCCHSGAALHVQKRFPRHLFETKAKVS